MKPLTATVVIGALAFAATPALAEMRTLATAGRCSALVAVAPEQTDVYVGHATWDSFSQATKIFKHFSTAWGGVGVPLASQRVSSSSFPGEVRGRGGEGGKKGGEKKRGKL